MTATTTVPPLTCLTCGNTRQYTGVGWVKCQNCAPRGPIERTPGTLTGRNDNAVQRGGAQAALPKAGTNRRRVLDALETAGPNGMTFDELGSHLDMNYSHLGPRVRELKRDGFVIDAGTVRPGASGADQTVWMAV